MIPQFGALTAVLTAAALAIPAIPAGAVTVNIFTPDLQQLKKDYIAEKAKTVADHTDKLRKMLDEALARYQAMLDKHKVTGNISGQAIARTGISAFTDMKDQLEKTRDFKWPERIRREMMADIEELKARKAAMDEPHAAAMKAVDDKYMESFTAKCRAQGADTSDPARVREWFRDLAGSEERTAPGTGTPGASSNAVPEFSEESSGGAAGTNWVPFARWYAEIGGMEVVEVPVMGRRVEKTEKITGFEGRTFEARYLPIRELAPGAGQAFRIRNLPGKQGGAAVQWPSARNGWKLLLRLRPGREFPSQHAMEFQVSYPGAETLPLVAGVTLPDDGAGGVSGGVTSAPAAMVTVSIQTRPEGAVVLLDGQVVQTNNVTLRTPCRFQVRAGRHDLTLRKFGCKEVKLQNFVAEEGRALVWNLPRDPNLVEKSFQVPARSRWRDSGIQVAPGDMVIVEVTGSWSCGSKGETVGPEGYPNDQRFFHYYIDPRSNPRQIPKVNYGALLMRVGPGGKIVGVSDRDFRAQVNTAGTLYFDINEAEGPARGDNQGALNLRVLKGPAPR